MFYCYSTVSSSKTSSQTSSKHFYLTYCTCNLFAFKKLLHIIIFMLGLDYYVTLFSILICAFTHSTCTNKYLSYKYHTKYKFHFTFVPTILTVMMKGTLFTSSKTKVKCRSCCHTLPWKEIHTSLTYFTEQKAVFSGISIT